MKQNNNKIKELRLLPKVMLFMVVFLTTIFKTEAQQVKVAKDSISVKTKGETGILYDEILSDPRNRHYLEMSKQGWFGGRESNTFLRFGGYVQANLIGDFQNTGYDYGEFIPAGIPVPTDRTSNLAFDPRSTRVTFETQTNTKKGMINSFISVDFNGSNESGTIMPRMRQAYVAWVNAKQRQSILIGQATTTFTDGDTWPESFDLEGPNSMLYLRQGVLRYSFMLSKSDKWIGALALEQPSSEIQNGIGKTGIPDVIFTAKLKEKWGHLRVAALGRQLIAENDNGEDNLKSFAWGLSFSGQLKLSHRQDNFQFQVGGGEGTGRYFQDLGSAESGQDAVYDDVAVSLTPLNAFGGFISYQHWWSDIWRTNVAGGYVSVSNQTVQVDDSLNQTTYILLNTICSPLKNLDVGLEYYYGKRVNKNEAYGYANRLMLGVKYKI